MPAGEPPNDVPAPHEVERLVGRHEPLLVRWFEKHASGLLRYESAEDLAQYAALQAFEARERYRHRDEAGFVGWLLAIAAQVVADRHAYWRALKRDAGPAVRLTFGGSTADGSPGGALEPSVSATGPGTFASRREMLDRAVRALHALGSRDADLVRQQTEGVSIDETATRLGVSYEAAQRARLRACDRLRKVYSLASRPPG